LWPAGCVHTLPEQGHHGYLGILTPLRVQHDQKISAFPGGIFGSADDLGKEGEGEVENHNAQSVGTIGSQASSDGVGLVFQNSDCIQYFAVRIFTDPCRTANHIGTCSGGNPVELREFSLRHHWINSGVGLNSANAGPENETEEFDSLILNS
jgi:hypothetical protein